MSNFKIFPGTVKVFTPIDLEPDQWFRSDTVTLAGSDVSQLTDKSGNNNHGIGALGSRPSYDTSGPIPKIVFDKTDSEHINWPCLASPTAWTFTMVAKIPSIAAYPQQFWHSHQDAAGNQGTILRSDGVNMILEQFGDPASIGLGAVNTSLIQRDAQWTGSVLRYRENAAGWTSTACLSIDVIGATTGTIGAFFSGVQALDIEFYEYIYWLRALSDPELAKIRSYILKRYYLVLP